MQKLLLPLQQVFPGTSFPRNTVFKNLFRKGVFLPALFLTFLCSFPAFAQVTPQFFKGGGTGSNAFPFNTNSVKRSQHLYLPGDLPGALPGNIIRIYLRAATAGTAGTYSDFKISMGQSTATVFPGTASDNFFTGLTPVLTATSFTLPSQTVDAWVPIDLQIPFLYNPAQTLIVEFEMSAGSGGFSVRTSTGPAAPAHKRLTATSLTATTGNTSTIWTDFGMDVVPSTPCSGPPTAGTAVSSVSSVCPNTTFQLSLNGNVFASGLTYQWQSSTNGTTWTNITGATNPNFSATQTATTFYRAVLSCGAQSSNSGSVQVTTNATPISGFFTIDKNGTPSATTFTSFTSAINSFACGGLNGAITFNVAPNSGPYNEFIVIPSVPGTSTTNTITFNGNGNTISSPVASGDVIKLDGADFVKFDNLSISANPGIAAGTVISLLNAANNNTFINCTLTHSTSTTTTSQVISILSGSNNNTFQNNTLTGAYYGVYNTGAAALTNSNNTFINNTLKDQYFYGIYNAYALNTLVEGNDISRPTRTNAGTLYGIYLSTGCLNTMVSKNRLHNTYDAASSLTGTTYGFYTSAAATPGNENIFVNNILYNLNNTGGTIYALYNTGGNGTYYYHNTISIDNPAAAYTTVRGMYFLSASTNVKFINNNLSLSSPATTKHGIYLSSSTISLVSNGNNLFIPGGNVGYYTAARATLADWKLVNSNAYDQASISADPIFVNAATGNLRPSSVALNNAGIPLATVLTDITGAPRSASAPDPGAFEFTVSSDDVGITNISGVVSGCTLTANQTITVTVKNFGSATQTNIPVNYRVNGTITGSGTVPGPLLPNATVNFSFPTTANLGAPGPYTISASTLLITDADASNNTFTTSVSNSLIPNLPISLNFETPATGIGAVQVVTNPKSTIIEGAGAAFTGTKGMIMAGVNSTNWQTPVGVTNPWLNNLDNFSAIYMCINPSSGAPSDSLWLTFDLKQLYKTAAANTNFRVTVNGQQVGATFNPPFSGTPIVWQKVKIDLTAFKPLTNVQIGLESSTKEEYANGTGTANLIDNLKVVRRIVAGTREDALLKQLNIYPNPSAGIFNLTMPYPDYSFEVTDLTGRTILKQVSRDKNTQFNLSENAKGIYLIRITTKGTTATKRIILE